MNFEFDSIDLMMIGFMIFAIGMISIIIYNMYVMLIAVFGNSLIINAATLLVIIGGLIIVCGGMKKILYRD